LWSTEKLAKENISGDLDGYAKNYNNEKPRVIPTKGLIKPRFRPWILIHWSNETSTDDHKDNSEEYRMK